MRLALALTVILTCSSATLIARSPAPTERAAAAYLLALGRAPVAGEIVEGSSERDAPIVQQIARLRETLRSDASAQRAVATKARHDAFGPEKTERRNHDTPPLSGISYAELMRQHLRWLAEHPSEYEHVIHRAYQMVVRRDAYDLELAYWKKYDTLSYALLVGCIEDWARRNQPGLMVTAGTPTVSINSEFLTTVRLSPAVAQEAREAAGFASADEEFAPAFGRNLVAPGGAGLVTGGRMLFVAAGR